MRHFFSTFHRAVAALLLVAGVASAAPIALSTPTGLNVGDKFRFIAVTSGTTNATSTDVNTYNSFVQNDFGGATYNGVVVNWKAIGSTFTVNARDNVGGFNTNVPVYKPFTGTLVANNMMTASNGLWGLNILSPINELITGTLSSPRSPWTGSNGDGLKFSGYALGQSQVINRITNSQYNLAVSGILGNSTNDSMYGLSEELTVAPSAVPEIDPAGMGSVMALVTGGLGLLERRRLARKRS